jgi:hypothetical protein
MTSAIHRRDEFGRKPCGLAATGAAGKIGGGHRGRANESVDADGPTKTRGAKARVIG